MDKKPVFSNWHGSNRFLNWFMRNKTAMVQDYAVLFQQGDENAFEHFFRKYFAPLYLFANRMVKNTQVAEDCTQESFIKLWEKRKGFDSEKAIRTYLYTVTRNACIDYQRNHISTQQKQKKLYAVSGNEQTEDNIFENEMLYVEMLRNVHTSLQQLPKECRKIFNMLYIEGKPYEEIAKKLQLSPSTIRNQKARGLQLLKKRLGVVSMLIVMIHFF